MKVNLNVGGELSGLSRNIFFQVTHCNPRGAQEGTRRVFVLFFGNNDTVYKFKRSELFQIFT